MKRPTTKDTWDRVKYVAALLSRRISRKDIVLHVSEKWGVQERQADRYIKKAKDHIKEHHNQKDDPDYEVAVNIQAMEEDLQMLISERDKIQKDKSVNSKTRIWAITQLQSKINEIRKEIGKIKGMYIDRIDHTTGGEKLNSDEDLQKKIEALEKIVNA